MPDNPEKTEDSIEWIAPAEGVSEIYSNFVSLNWTLYDVRIRLGQILPEEKREGLRWKIIEDSAATLPWGQAVVLRDMLNQAIKRYEEVNGPFVQPKLP